MHVAHANFFPAPKELDAAGVLAHWPSLADIPEAVASAGVRVSVIQAAVTRERLMRNHVDYHFIDMAPANTVEECARRYAQVLEAIHADVLHVHGLGFARHASFIAHLLPQLPILLQDHADRAPRWWRRPQWRRWYACAQGVAFTTTELARPFVGAGMFAPHTTLFSIPESSCRFTCGDQARAQAETGLYGDPCVLWVGHLSDGKDPLTVLDGIAQAVARLPGIQLWCAFGSAPLLQDVHARLAQDPSLAARVHLLGKLPHAHVERLMQSADLFVSGSHAESCGYALLEAMACGVVPVVTDIPSFRALTDDGRVGRLWPCGDATRLADALVSLARARPTRAHVRAHFDASLSFAAVGRKWAQAYGHVFDDHRRGVS
ncbi:glycosyltransferase [Dyella monticola]|uniref:Glycosyltransferase n=1 Tax=Dyella monticola TaxID=1927958 RepID=A0A370X662_9GAMM|nr:glycosyltransferase family 4 protein [Dyella monticola]RDS83914.1 glycosyltransferase [Dyella monticola]